MAKRVYRRKKTYRKKKTFRKKKFKKRQLATFAIKAELRARMMGKSWGGHGTDGARCAVYWGEAPTGLLNFNDESQVSGPFETYEWNNWAAKFEEYQITGVKIKIMPTIQSGLNGTGNYNVIGSIGMGSFPKDIKDANDIQTQVLYGCNDYGVKGPDPSKPTLRFYKPALSLRKKLALTWMSTREALDVPYTSAVTYINWEAPDVGDNNDALTKMLGMLYITYYYKFRRPRHENIAPE